MNQQRTDIPQFRPEMAYPILSDAVLERLRPYGREETHEAAYIFYTFGARQTDMLVILEGEGEPRAAIRRSRPKTSSLASAAVNSAVK